MKLNNIFTHINGWRKPIGWFLLLYLLLGWIFYANQDRFIFRARVIQTNETLKINSPHQELSIPIDQKDTLQLVLFKTTRIPARGVVLYFHGNRENVEWYAPQADLFTQEGYEVMMMDYPGYGKSRGERSESKIYQWATWVYQLARKKYEPKQIILYGKSLGTGVASYLASKKDCYSKLPTQIFQLYFLIICPFIRSNLYYTINFQQNSICNKLMYPFE